MLPAQARPIPARRKGRGYFPITSDEEGKEVDFALAGKGTLTHFLEVKLSDEAASRNLRYFKQRYPEVNAVQLVHNARNEQQFDDISIVRAGDWLARLKA